MELVLGACCHGAFMVGAEQGDATCLRSISGMYLYGYGVEQDFDASFEWASKAAKQGDLVSMTVPCLRHLSRIRAQMRTLSPVSPLITHFFPDSQLVGKHYFEGTGVSQNDKLAKQW